MCSIFICLILSVCVVKGKQFHGACPEPAPTHFYPINESDSTQYYVLRVVPYDSSATPSYVFNNWIQNFQVIFTPSRDLNKLILEFCPDPEQSPFLCIHAVDGDFEYPTNSFYLESDIYVRRGDKEDCSKTITHLSRMWIDGEFIFLWSCTDTTTSGGHGEAVMIIGPKDVLNRNDFEKNIKSMKATSGKYLTVPLVQAIDWTYINWSDKYDRLDCPVPVGNPHKKYFLPIVGVVGTFLLFSIVAVVYIYISSEWIADRMYLTRKE